MNQQFKPKTVDRSRKHPNALKHGVFSTVATLPGEDPERFAQLHSILIKEWNPVGPTEEDAVFSLAKSMWYKARLQNFLLAKIGACKRDTRHPAFDPVGTFSGIAGVLEIDPDSLDQYLKFLPKGLQEHLERKFSDDDFETISARARAIKNEIETVILPELTLFDKPIELSFLEASDILTPDEFKNLIGLEERIDAMIDRAIKRLVHTKTMKQMLESTRNLS